MRLPHCFLRLALVAVVLSVAAGVGWAAPTVTTGTLSGTVTNAATAAIIVGATVKADNGTTAYTALTGSKGTYKLTLPAGTFTVTCTATGFTTYTKTGVAILAGKTTTLNIALSGTVSYGGVEHVTKIAAYAGPSTCLTCHATSDYGTDLLTDVFTSSHFQFRTTSSFVDIPGRGSHGMADRACGLPGTNMMAGNYAGTALSVDGTVTKTDGCGKCHPAYRPALAYTDATAAQADIDCLLCHAEVYAAEWDDPAVIALYGTNPQPHSRTVITLTDGAKSWSQDRSLKTAQSVGNLPKTKYCLRCHAHNFDGSKRPTPYEAATDIHAAKSFECSKCHTGKSHKIPRGNYVTDMHANEVPTSDVSCDKCHGVAPHIAANAADLNKHSANLACELCHIPTMDTTGNTAVRSWAPYTLDPRTGSWSTTPAALISGFYDANSQYYPVGERTAVRWFNAKASMLAQPAGSYDDRASAGGCSKLFGLKSFVNGMLFDAAWLPGPPADFDLVGAVWPYSMRAFFEQNWEAYLAAGFIDSAYPTPASYWNERPEMAAMLNQLPMMLYMDRKVFLSEGGKVLGTPVPGPQDAATYPGLVKAIDAGLGAIGIGMGYFPPESDPVVVGKTLWSGRFFGMWVPVNMDPASPFQGELASFITLSHAVKSGAELVARGSLCDDCHYTEAEYGGGQVLDKWADFAALGFPNLDANPIVDPLYDRVIQVPVPAVDRITFAYTASKSSQSLKTTVYVVDSVSRAPLPNVTVAGTLTGPAGQTGLPASFTGVTDATGAVTFSFSQKALLTGTYTFTVNTLTLNGVVTTSGVSCSYTK